MSGDTLRRILSQCGAGDSVFFSGGEATLRGLEFFRLAQELSPKTEFHLQTAGHTLNAHWFDFFMEHQWMIGVSLDGPNSLRGGDHEHVEWVCACLRELGVEYSILCTIYKQNVHDPVGLVHYLSEHGEFIQFIPAKPRFPGDSEFTVTGSEFKVFLEEVAGVVRPGGVEVAVRNFQEGRAAWMGKPISCEQLQNCGSYLLVHPDGRVTPCDFFPDWIVGTVEDDLETLLQGKEMAEFRALKSLPSAPCERCEVIRSCWRGCIADRYLARRSFYDHTPLCEAHEYVGTITKPR